MQVATTAPRESTRRGAGDSPRGSGRDGRGRAWLLWLPLLVLLAVASAVGWLYGREVAANAVAAVDIAKLSGSVPGWAFIGAPAAVIAIVGLVTAYLAFGRHMAVKLIGVAVVIVTLALPGLAVGWANGTVSTVGQRSAEVEADVARTEQNLRPALPGEAVSILLIGRDRDREDDPGRSDTQILVRLDPHTKSMSMLSVPRDLRMEIPGYGLDKVNAAYSYGGSALVVESLTALTQLPINHFIEVDFAGFWHAVNILGGVYIPVDRRYYNPESSSYKSIDIMPGYQLMRGHDALDFVRFRHDQKADFGRMQRQQLFLREAQRQSGRWSSDWKKVALLINSITAETTSDIDSLARLRPLIELVFQVDTSKISAVHIEGATPTIDGISYVIPTQTEIANAVAEFTHPTEAPVRSRTQGLTKKMYAISVVNASGIEGLATPAVGQLASLGYSVRSGPDAPEFTGTVTVVYAPKSLAGPAKAVAAKFVSSEVRLLERTPGSSEKIRVFVTSSFDGTLVVPEAIEEPEQALMTGQDYDAASWQALAAETPVRLEMPSAWPLGSVYDEFHAYTIKSTTGKEVPAAVASVRTPDAGYWSIQATRWLQPPAIENPSEKRSIDGTKYLLFYEGERLHMVAWQRKKTLYWILNTLDNELSKDLMLGLATSFKPVK